MVKKKTPPKAKAKAKPTKAKKPRNPVPPTPRPLNEEETVLQAVMQERGMKYLIAERLGVTTQTIRNYARRWPSVKEALAKAKGKRLDVAERKLDAAVERGDVRAITYFLDRQGKKRGYVPRQEVRMGGDTDAPPVQTENMIKLRGLPIELRRQILAAFRSQKNGQQNAPPPQNAVEINLVSEGTGNEIGESSPACESHD